MEHRSFGFRHRVEALGRRSFVSMGEARAIVLVHVLEVPVLTNFILLLKEAISRLYCDAPRRLHAAEVPSDHLEPVGQIMVDRLMNPLERRQSDVKKNCRSVSNVSRSGRFPGTHVGDSIRARRERYGIGELRRQRCNDQLYGE